jgi:exonuclease SbcC
MKILSASINNILSIENAHVDFDDNGLMLVQGWNYDVGRSNGAGKTAIFNAITYALFDKLPRKVTATEILRRGCKTGHVELCIEVGGDRYVVRRSRPKGVVVSKGGQTLTITQEGWERILGLNYNQFIISMYCAQGTTTRFLSINDSDKKQFLLQLLNLEEFSSCKLIADNKVKLFESELDAFKSKIDVIDSKIDAYNESLVDENVINYHYQMGQKAIKDMTAELINVQSVPRPDLSKYQKLEDDLATKRTELTQAKTKREIYLDQFRRTQSKIKPFIATSACKACGQSIDASSAQIQHHTEVCGHELELSSLKAKIDECDALLIREQQINELYSKLKNKKKDESREYEISSIKSAELQSQILNKQRELKELNLKLQNNLELESKIKVLRKSRTHIANVKASKLREIELYRTVSAIYSPTGAQAYILDSVIDSFNERIQEYVNLLWSNMTYELQSYKENVKGDVSAKFSELLVMDGKSISIGSLSGGEFRALSLCVDFALVNVMERQFGISMSPIVLDEVFDGLDASGKELMIELLETISKDRQIVVIDHASEVAASFSKVLRVEKRNGISSIAKSEDM